LIISENLRQIESTTFSSGVRRAGEQQADCIDSPICRDAIAP